MNIIYDLFYYIRSCISILILKYIIGWRFKQNSKSYTKYRTGKYVAIYSHTSIYDHLIGVLFSYAFNLKFITVGTHRSGHKLGHKLVNDVQSTTQYLYDLVDTIIIDPRKNKQTTCEDIIKNLDSKENYIFSICPEGSIHRTSGFKSGFYKISKSIRSDILLFDLDYNKHTVDLRKIIDSNIILTSPYPRIVEIVTEEMIRSTPFNASRTFLEVKFKPTSLMNINGSLLRFVPLICVLTIVAFNLYPYLF